MEIYHLFISGKSSKHRQRWITQGSFLKQHVFSLCFSLCLFCPVISSTSPAAPSPSTMSCHIPAQTSPQPPPNEIQHKHTCNQANFSLPCIHPSFHPTIHPSRLTSKEDGASDAALASAAPPLKGHTCSLLWPTVLL